MNKHWSARLDETPGQQVARESAAPRSVHQHPGDTLSDFDRMIAGANSVQVRLPLRDVSEMRRHLDVLAGALNDARAMLDHSGQKDRSLIIAVHGIFRQASRRINAFPRGRK